MVVVAATLGKEAARIAILARGRRGGLARDDVFLRVSVAARVGREELAARPERARDRLLRMPAEAEASLLKAASLAPRASVDVGVELIGRNRRTVLKETVSDHVGFTASDDAHQVLVVGDAKDAVNLDSEAAGGDGRDLVEVQSRVLIDSDVGAGHAELVVLGGGGDAKSHCWWFGCERGQRGAAGGGM